MSTHHQSLDRLRKKSKPLKITPKQKTETVHWMRKMNENQNKGKKSRNATQTNAIRYSVHKPAYLILASEHR